jgi:GMP synthase-like glutamine amidotransferase
MTVRVALLDLYKGIENRGIPALTQLIQTAGDGRHAIEMDRYDVRGTGEVPGLDYDVYVSSGGPGSPFDGEGEDWETAYFRWLDAVWNHNEQGKPPKSVLFICHSFQMMVRFFGIASVTKRREESFGIYEVHKTEAGRREVLFEALEDPFYAADFRHWQAVEANRDRLQELGGTILAREKPRPHVPLERAIMAIRMSPHLVAVQFHPEANPDGMFAHFRKPERRKQVVDKVGKRDYHRLLRRLNEPTFLQPTYKHVVPTFLQRSIGTARPEVRAV